MYVYTQLHACFYVNAPNTCIRAYTYMSICTQLHTFLFNYTRSFSIHASACVLTYWSTCICMNEYTHKHQNKQNYEHKHKPDCIYKEKYAHLYDVYTWSLVIHMCLDMYGHICASRHARACTHVGFQNNHVKTPAILTSSPGCTVTIQ